MNIIGKKNWYFLLSALIIIPGVVSLLLWGLKYGIDFTGGSKLEFQIASVKKFQNATATSAAIINPLNTQVFPNQIVEAVGKDAKITKIQMLSKNDFLIQTNPLDQKQKIKVENDLKSNFAGYKEKSFQTIGPTIGAETESNAMKAVLIASAVIMIFIAYTFRKVSRPVASWKFGVCAVLALLHDVLVVVGIFSLFGRFLGVEVDSLFITALLTVMGFSVHDTIVVFDRIRENLSRQNTQTFEETVNDSMFETLNRSLNTSLTVLLVLVSLLLFGGDSIRWFVVALLVGIISGTYSSIFNASPLLVAWYEWDLRRRRK